MICKKPFGGVSFQQMTTKLCAFFKSVNLLSPIWCIEDVLPPILSKNISSIMLKSPAKIVLICFSMNFGSI